MFAQYNVNPLLGSLQQYHCYLASASPRRLALLQQLQLTFETYPVDIDESNQDNEEPHDYVQRVTACKAKTALSAILKTQPTQNPLIISADTCVVMEHQIFGKPKDYEDFLNIMQTLSGRTHQVLTAVAVLDQYRYVSAISISEVTFRQLSIHDIKDYWHTQEPMDKAGGYAVQGLAAIFIQQIKGSYSGIMGLPLYETAQCLKEFTQH